MLVVAADERCGIPRKVARKEEKEETDLILPVRSAGRDGLANIQLARYNLYDDIYVFSPVARVKGADRV